ncbi:MAG: DUF5691 domain-containing protein, partial [Hylemonella sp.]|nr:DUF5691 domain-containing protein [Hylemonella sp.]
ADLEAALGFAQDRDALLASAGISDRWCVLGAIDGEDDGLRHQRTWLHGERSGRSALLLDFAARAQVLPAYGPAGSCFEGELVFYPGAWPQRALLKQRGETQAGGQLSGALSSVPAALDQFVQAASQLPWLERIGLTLQAVTPLYRDQAWSVVDASGAMLPLCADTGNAWELLAVSGGQQLTVFGEFDGECLLPLSVADASGAQALPAGLTRVGGVGAMAQLPAWRAATTAALLGAERQQQALSAPGPLGETLARLYPQAALPASAEQRSAALLDALAVLSLYRRGARPPAEVAALPAACETDDWPAAGAQAASQLRQIIEDEGAELLHEWLAVAAQARRRCPELLLPRLLERLARGRSPMPAQSSVLGGRGRWLALQHEDWRALLTQAASDDAERPWAAQWLAHWEEGSTAQRCAALQALRQREPQAAQQRLAAVFAAEPAAVRAALLDTLATGLGPADEAWLEACLTDKSQEVRQRAAALLSRLPDSGFGQRVEARAQTWLQFKPKTGLLSRIGGSKGELAVLLPEAWDAAWMRDGLIEKPPRGQGAKAWWLAQTLALVPPSSWARQWGLTPADCLSLLDGHEWREPLRTGWLQATLTQADADWAAAWLAAPAALADGSERAPLWRLLPPTQRAERLLQALAQARGAALRDLLQLLPELDLAWDDAVSA